MSRNNNELEMSMMGKRFALKNCIEEEMKNIKNEDLSEINDRNLLSSNSMICELYIKNVDGIERPFVTTLDPKISIRFKVDWGSDYITDEGKRYELRELKPLLEQFIKDKMKKFEGDISKLKLEISLESEDYSLGSNAQLVIINLEIEKKKLYMKQMSHDQFSEIKNFDILEGLKSEKGDKLEGLKEKEEDIKKVFWMSNIHSITELKDTEIGRYKKYNFDESEKFLKHYEIKESFIRSERILVDKEGNIYIYN